MKEYSTRSLAIALAILAAGVLLVMFLTGPIEQTQNYHNFSDRRGLGGIPNAWNVLSNLAYLFVGFLGFVMCLGRRPPGARRAWITFFAAVMFVAAGSSFYHWNPNDASLAWDRLPMAISFMALLVAVAAEDLRLSLERMLIPLVIAGAASIFFWRLTGDLRPYVVVQFFPLLAVLLCLLMRRGTFNHREHLPIALGFYTLAKWAELGDLVIFDLTGGQVGGHSVKHLLSAAGVLFIVRMLARRGPVT